MNKRERLEKTFAGEKNDRVPVSLWRHWPGDDQRPADLARAVVTFQKQWDWDFVKVTPASSYSIRDWGVEDRWVGSLEGTREYTRRVIHAPEDWARLPRLDPSTGTLGEQLETLRLVKAGLDADVPTLHTIFNPLAQAKNLAGGDVLLRHIQEAPDAVTAGLQIIAENTLRYLDVLQHTPIDGIFYAIQHASYSLLTEDEYQTLGRAFDLQLLAALPAHWWFNMLHLHGETPMFGLVADYPVQSINWHDRETTPSLVEGQQKFGGAVCGGLGRWDFVHNGTPDQVREQALDAIHQTEGSRFILSTGCVMMITSPQANIRAVREAVE